MERCASHHPTVEKENIAGECIPTTVDQSPRKFTPTLSKALFGHAVARLSWMHERSVVSLALGSAPEKESHVCQFN